MSPSAKTWVPPDKGPTCSWETGTRVLDHSWIEDAHILPTLALV